MSIVSKENVIVSKEPINVLKEPVKVFKGIDQKKAIIIATAGIIGIKVAEFVAKYSPILDKFIFKSVPAYLMEEGFSFMGYLPIPNWFVIFCFISLFVYAFAEMKIVERELLQKTRRR